jgi:NADH-quinone oxidoreductase subunit N
MNFGWELIVITAILWVILKINSGNHLKQYNNKELQERESLLSKEISLSFVFLLILSLGFLYPEFIFNKQYYSIFNGLHVQLFYQVAGFMTNPLFLFFKTLAILITIVCLLCAAFYLEQQEFKRIEYPIFILTALWATILLITSTNLIFIYLSLELLNFCIYLLIAAKKNSIKAIEASLRYFTYSSYASAVFLLGLSLIYGLFGTVDILQLHILTELLGNNFQITENYVIQGKFLYNLALFCLILPLTFKLGLVPLHFWMPEVYDGSPLITTLFIATVPKIAYITLLIKVLLFSHAPAIIVVTLSILSIITIIYATIVILYESNFKRFLAYSTIANMGFITLSLSIMSANAIQASITYLVIYLLTTLAVFGIILLLGPNINLSKKEFKEPQYIYNLKGIGQYFFHSLYFAIAILSLAGIPPLAGFFIKLEVLTALYLEGNVLLAYIAFLFSVILSVAYLRIVRIVLLTELTTSYNKENVKMEFFIIKEKRVLTFFIIMAIIIIIVLYPFLLFNNLTQMTHYFGLLIASYV